MWSTDYPHQASTFPRSQQFVEEKLGDLPAQDRRRIVWDNAVDLYGLSV